MTEAGQPIITWRRPGAAGAAVVAAALLICLVVYARGLVTPIGIRSFGREFGWYVNYFDLGFVHRGLVGSIVVLFAPQPVANSYTIPFAVYPAFLLAATFSGLYASGRWFAEPPERTRYLAILLLSPAFVTHYAYSTGDLNVLLATILVFSLIFVRNSLALLVLLAVAMAIHEIFFVAFAPCVCVAIYLADGQRLGRSVAYGAAAAALFVLFSRYGTIGVSSDEFLTIMQRRVDLSINPYLEMTGTISQNFEVTRPLFSSFTKIAWIIPPLIYWGIVTALFFPLRQSRFTALIYLAAATAPLILFPFGTDLFRWVAMASVAAIVLGGFLRSQGCHSLIAAYPRRSLALTLPWIVFGPFGSACLSTGAGCQRPFPMFQFLIERF